MFLILLFLKNLEFFTLKCQFNQKRQLSFLYRSSFSDTSWNYVGVSICKLSFLSPLTRILNSPSQLCVTTNRFYIENITSASICVFHESSQYLLLIRDDIYPVFKVRMFTKCTQKGGGTKIHVLQKIQSIAIQHWSLCYAQKHSSHLKKNVIVSK